MSNKTFTIKTQDNKIIKVDERIRDFSKLFANILDDYKLNQSVETPKI